jgi:hypothetical protein
MKTIVLLVCIVAIVSAKSLYDLLSDSGNRVECTICTQNCNAIREDPAAYEKCQRVCKSMFCHESQVSKNLECAACSDNCDDLSSPAERRTCQRVCTTYCGQTLEDNDVEWNSPECMRCQSNCDSEAPNAQSYCNEQCIKTACKKIAPAQGTKGCAECNKECDVLDTDKEQNICRKVCMKVFCH